MPACVKEVLRTVLLFACLRAMIDLCESIVQLSVVSGNHCLGPGTMVADAQGFRCIYEY